MKRTRGTTSTVGVHPRCPTPTTGESRACTTTTGDIVSQGKRILYRSYDTCRVWHFRGHGTRQVGRTRTPGGACAHVVQVRDCTTTRH